MALAKDDFETKIARASVNVAAAIVMTILVVIGLIVVVAIASAIFGSSNFGQAFAALMVFIPGAIVAVIVLLLVVGAFFVLAAIWRTLERIEAQLARQAEGR